MSENTIKEVDQTGQAEAGDWVRTIAALEGALKEEREANEHLHRAVDQLQKDRDRFGARAHEAEKLVKELRLDRDALRLQTDKLGQRNQQLAFQNQEAGIYELETSLSRLQEEVQQLRAEYTKIEASNRVLMASRDDNSNAILMLRDIRWALEKRVKELEASNRQHVAALEQVRSALSLSDGGVLELELRRDAARDGDVRLPRQQLEELVDALCHFLKS